MKTKCFLPIALPLIFMIGSCSPVTLSTSRVAPRQLPTHLHGLPYFLPIGLIVIKGDHETPASSHQGKDKQGTEADTAAASAEPVSTPPTQSASTNVVTLSVAGWTLTISGEVEADPEAREFVQPQRNYIFDDEYHVSVNSKHLLSAGNATAEDQTAHVIGAVASLVTSATEAAPRIVTTTPEDRNKPFLVSFHTNRCEEWQAARELLSTRGFSLDLDPPPCASSGKNPAALPRTGVDGRKGLVFRLAEPYLVSLGYHDVAGTKLLQTSHRLILPGLDEYVLDYGRAPFVKKVKEIGFTDGMLSDYHETFPSPILGVLGIPKSIIAAIIPLPSDASTGGSGSTAGSSALPAQ